jgi:ABC-type arginine transport system permease subunit
MTTKYTNPFESRPLGTLKPVWLGALALLLVAGAGTFFYTKNGAAKADEAGKKDSAPVTLEFAPGDVARVVMPSRWRIALPSVARSPPPPRPRSRPA